MTSSVLGTTSALSTLSDLAQAARDDQALLGYRKLPGADTAVATPDHDYPFLYAPGAAGPAERARTVFESFHAGTLSMRCVQFG
ncbi:hypothetical protein [Xylophilus sp. ASV27]|uniref:hypothetical protein n=1 Tax=Xylophilus sp. ASV27 TaxID=2795129 RepID=UPI001E381BD9|nr:hypothetical protein [Xylophilus sp. ASV27]